MSVLPGIMATRFLCFPASKCSVSTCVVSLFETEEKMYPLRKSSFAKQRSLLGLQGLERWLSS